MLSVPSEVASDYGYLAEPYEYKDHNSENNIPKNEVISLSLVLLNSRLDVFLKWYVRAHTEVIGLMQRLMGKGPLAVLCRQSD